MLFLLLKCRWTQNAGAVGVVSVVVVDAIVTAICCYILAVQDQTTAGDILLCSWARHFLSQCLTPPRCINGYRRT